MLWVFIQSLAGKEIENNFYYKNNTTIFRYQANPDRNRLGNALKRFTNPS